MSRHEPKPNPNSFSWYKISISAGFQKISGNIIEIPGQGWDSQEFFLYRGRTQHGSIKETYRKDLHKRTTEKTYKRDLQERHTKETSYKRPAKETDIHKTFWLVLLLVFMHAICHTHRYATCHTHCYATCHTHRYATCHTHCYATCHTHRYATCHTHC